VGKAETKVLYLEAMGAVRIQAVTQVEYKSKIGLENSELGPWAMEAK